VLPPPLPASFLPSGRILILDTSHHGVFRHGFLLLGAILGASLHALHMVQDFSVLAALLCFPLTASLLLFELTLEYASIDPIESQEVHRRQCASRALQDVDFRWGRRNKIVTDILPKMKALNSHWMVTL
jgi:hypothetical protein